MALLAMPVSSRAIRLGGGQASTRGRTSETRKKYERKEVRLQIRGGWEG